jgi:hypothetical protein
MQGLVPRILDRLEELRLTHRGILRPGFVDHSGTDEVEVEMHALESSGENIAQGRLACSCRTGDEDHCAHATVSLGRVAVMLERRS